MTRNGDALTVHAPDGTPLHADVHAPYGRAKGTILALHAMMVDRRSMDRPKDRGFASVLAGAGWRVVRADFRGRGDVGGPGWRHDWRYEDLVLQDVPTWIRAARRWGDGPVVVAGHSLGGHVTAASIAAGVARPDALAMMAANVWMPALEPDPGRRWAKHLALAAFRGVATVAGRVPARRLRIGPADEARSYAADLANAMHRGWWGTRDRTQDWWMAWGDVALPVAAWVATGDRLLAHPVGASAFAHHGGGEVHVVGGGGCGVVGDPDHMGLITDPRSEPAWRHMAAWAERVTAQRA